MTDTDEAAPPCEACQQDTGEYEGLCFTCYFNAIDEELSCDWLPDEDQETT